MVAQENILRALTEANANFADLRRQIVEGNERLVNYLERCSLPIAHDLNEPQV